MFFILFSFLSNNFIVHGYNTAQAVIINLSDDLFICSFPKSIAASWAIRISLIKSIAVSIFPCAGSFRRFCHKFYLLIFFKVFYDTIYAVNIHADNFPYLVLG